MDAKKLRIKAFFAISLVILLYTATFSVKNFVRYSSFKKDLVLQKKINDRLVQENSGYTKTIAFMKFDQYWILEAKKELGYIQSNEKIYKFYDKGKL